MLKNGSKWPCGRFFFSHFKPLKQQYRPESHIDSHFPDKTHFLTKLGGKFGQIFGRGRGGGVSESGGGACFEIRVSHHPTLTPTPKSMYACPPYQQTKLSPIPLSLPFSLTLFLPLSLCFLSFSLSLSPTQHTQTAHPEHL
jgi:hypothetical protein